MFENLLRIDQGSTWALLSLLCSAVAMAGLALLLWTRRARGSKKERRDLIIHTAFSKVPMAVLSTDFTVAFANSAMRLILRDIEEDRPLADALRALMVDPERYCSTLSENLEKSARARSRLTLAQGAVFLNLSRPSTSYVLLEAEHVSQETETEFSQPVIQIKTSSVVALNHAASLMLGAPELSLVRVFPQMVPRYGMTTLIKTAQGHAKKCLFPLDPDTQTYIVLPPTLREEQADSLVSEKVPVPLLRINMDGQIVQANSRAAKILHLEPKERPNLSEVVGDLGRSLSEWLRDTINEKNTNTSEFLTVLRGQGDAFVQMSLVKADGIGEPQVVAVLADATQFKALEMQFLQSQKMQAIGQLSGGVAHDFNNLITAISGHCELLLVNRDATDSDFNDLVQIRENSNRAAGLVRKLLAFSRKQTLTIEECNLNALVVDVTHLLNRLVGDNINLAFEICQSIPPVRLDKRQFEQVLVNLVVNARDAMEEGGSIVVSTERLTYSKPFKIQNVTMADGEFAVVRVKDSGKGIAPSHLKKVFEPFFTTKPVGEGTGLGLSMVYGTIKQIGGYIFVDSTVDEGTTISVYLPTSQEGVGPQEQYNEPVIERKLPQEEREKCSVLLVEDEASVRSFAARALKLSGYEVIECECGQDGLEMMQKRGQEIEVIITDVMMPGQSGPEWVRAAQRLRPDVRVIFVSGYTPEKLGFELDEFGGEEASFLAKPFKLTDLVEKVQRKDHARKASAQVE